MCPEPQLLVIIPPFRTVRNNAWGVLANPPRSRQDDNDDYCSACGGVGDLVCCENCSRSFHFECVDLGLDEKLPEEWFCNVCLSGRVSAKPSETRGPFGGLMGELDKINPQAYKLPHLVQGFFEGVKAGTEGDYEDLVAAAKPLRYVSHPCPSSAFPSPLACLREATSAYLSQ